MSWERITAAQIQVGDKIASTRRDDLARTPNLLIPVAEIVDHEKSRFITFETGGRIRPRYETKAVEERIRSLTPEQADELERVIRE